MLYGEQDLSYPKVSICIPSCCEPGFLEEAIRSCLVQSYRNFEIIVSDDTPDDSVAQVVARYTAEDARVRYFRNLAPHGAAANSNFAARQATGEWIKFLYHDDAFVCEESLALFVANSDKADLLFSPCVWIREDSRGIYRIGGDVYADLLHDPVATLVSRGNIIGAPSAFMVRREKLLPFDETMVWLFDVFFYIQIAQNGASFHCLEEPAVLINQHKNQLTEKVQNDPAVELREGVAIARFVASLGTHKMLVFRHALHLAFSLGRKHDYSEFVTILYQTDYRPMGVLCAWLAGRTARMFNMKLPRKIVEKLSPL